MSGSTSTSGQASTTSSANTNPFAKNQSGRSNPFGSSSGSSLSGVTLTRVFGQASAPAFGAFSSPAVGSSMPAFGTSSFSTGPSASGQKPTFGRHGSSPNQPNPFGSTIQQTQAAFGSTGFGSTTSFGASSQSTFPSTNTATPFGRTPSFGVRASQAFGSTATSAPIGTGTVFGVPSIPPFGVPSFNSVGLRIFRPQSASPFETTRTSAFGAQSSSGFGSSSTSALDAVSIPNSPSAPTSGQPSEPTYSFGFTPSFVHSASTSGTIQFSTMPSSVGSQSSSLASQTTKSSFSFGIQGFGKSSSSGQQEGSRVTRHTTTIGPSGTTSDGNLESISAMPVYEDKSHEELRWQDYQRGDKGGPSHGGQPAAGIHFPSSTLGTASGSVGIAGQTTAAEPTYNHFAPTTSTIGLTVSAHTSTSVLSSSFNAPSIRPFGSTSSSTSIFVGPNAHAFTSSFAKLSLSVVGSSSAFGPSLIPSNNQSSGLFQSSAPSVMQTSFPSVQPTTGFQQQTTSASNIPTFGSSSSGFGAPSAPTYSFGLAPSFVHSTLIPGTSQFSATPLPVSSQSCSCASQTAISSFSFGSQGFGQSPSWGQQWGSRVARHTGTPIQCDGPGGTKSNESLASISAMPVYQDRSHEELRWQDYQGGDKGMNHPIQCDGPRGTKSNENLASIFAMPVYQDRSHEELRWQDYQGGDKGGPSHAEQPAVSVRFPSSTLGTTSGSAGILGQTTTAISVMTSPYTAPSISPLGSTSSLVFVGPTAHVFTSSSSNLGNTVVGSSSAFDPSLISSNAQSSGLLDQRSTPSCLPTSFPSVQHTTGFQQQTSSSSSDLLSSPAIRFVGTLLSNSAPSVFSISTTVCGQTTNAPSTVFQPVTSAPTSSTFPSASSSGFNGISNILGQSNVGQPDSTRPNILLQPLPTTNPLGTLPASFQYGISSMPVVQKPSQVRMSTLSVPRHLSRRRIRLPVKKYTPIVDDPKVPFFVDDKELSAVSKTNTQLVPREDPKSVIIRPVEQQPSRNASPAVNDDTEEQNASISPSNTTGQKPNQISSKRPPEEIDTSYVITNVHKACDVVIDYDHDSGIEASMPKLHHTDHFHEPRIQELLAKERADPGFCCHVKDFVVGRHGYGCIKFYGETDVRRLDLESIVQFNNREVIVYKDKNEKPSVGQGLNKPAEVTLLNVKCIDKKTGRHFTEGPNVEKYIQMLMRRAEEQGAEFVSFDAVRGIWKFNVKHFSCYRF